MNDSTYPTFKVVKTRLNETSCSRPDGLKYDAATMVDSSIVKAIDDEGFLKKL